ncbi:periplasmic solute binding protein [Magnetococcus marinus MC-1]|uniref:High-affinity zinc uptake system protein ZnuA n=1 Tax=Magnetococcus marinus (strain ATCC BAA-1437 / JCM 17883 / MC-1) TaxID=156889 RepID=A0LCI0_MAGMM|nr:zinc ABC transporter substrate-binding protein [Magnetococcus marinus]ABK45673.1 periplasmic solute binding protein [Magnetococcus marinus MC-1]
MPRSRVLSLLTLLTLLMFTPNSWAAPRVVVSILPLHALVAEVMQGVAQPQLLLDGGSSPHSYALRPSQARQLSQAELVVWMGAGLESFLVKPLQTLGKQTTLLTLHQVPGLALLENRQPLHWLEQSAVHDHDAHQDHAADTDHDLDAHQDHAADTDHDHDAHQDHAADTDHDHDAHQDHTADTVHDHDAHQDHTGHDHGKLDLHLWLDPQQAILMVHAVAKQLSQLDAANATRYQQNAQHLVERLEQLTLRLATQLEPVRQRPYLVFHDAYHYFERRFGLATTAALTLNPESRPSAKAMQQVRQLIQRQGAVCLFSEPQFEPAMVQAIARDTGLRTAELDPLGSQLQPGIGAYFTLLTNLANALSNCLTTP